jgi:hypothetical protein
MDNLQQGFKLGVIIFGSTETILSHRVCEPLYLVDHLWVDIPVANNLESMYVLSGRSLPVII